MAEEPEQAGPAREGTTSSGEVVAPAFYAAGSGGWRDWWLVLHPPYTAWHLSYVVIGACLAPRQHDTAPSDSPGVLLRGRDRRPGPRRAERPAVADPDGFRYLVATAVLGIAIAVAIGIVGVAETSWVLVPFIVVGPLVLIIYNAELLGGIVHNGPRVSPPPGAPSQCSRPT